MNLQQRSEAISINGMDMHYEVYGEGKPLLLLHGFSGSGAGLADIFKDFIKTHQLIIPDLRGHGRSTNPSNEYNFHQTALDVFALLDHLKINNCSAVGFSGGGMTLLHMAHQQPDKISSMTMVSAAPYFPPSTREFMKQVTVESHTKEEWEAMRKIHIYGDEQITMIWKQANAFSENQDMNFTSEKLSKIKAKTFIIQGDRDPIYPLEITIEMYKAIPNAYLWIIPNGGHGISTDVIPEFLNNLMKFMHWADAV